MISLIFLALFVYDNWDNPVGNSFAVGNAVLLGAADISISILIAAMVFGG